MWHILSVRPSFGLDLKERTNSLGTERCWKVERCPWSLGGSITPSGTRNWCSPKAGIILLVETGNSTKVNSNYTGRKLIEDLDAKDNPKVLWDPANNCWCHEAAFPNRNNELKDGYLGHLHIKDVKVNTPRATLEVCRMGEGQLAEQFQQITNAPRADNYDGVISFETVYHTGNWRFGEGCRLCIARFKSIFGNG